MPSLDSPPNGTPLTPGVGHYENFPVASLLCPPALRPPIAAIYHFARTADDLADEGDATPEQRLEQLAAYRVQLETCLSGATHASPWSHVFQPLADAIQSHQLPAQLLRDLISAFEQDVRYTALGHAYADQEELLAYCSLSANPVGRLLLHLYGIQDKTSLQQSDQICSALQLINFWQDISVDLPRKRHYLPSTLLNAHGLCLEDFHGEAVSDASVDQRRAKLVAELCSDARALMQKGAPLARRIPGRAGWELRLVVQGGLRILDKIAALDHRSWQTRPKLRKSDMPALLWRALWMR